MDTSSIIVCIPTYRRLKQLSTLMRALAEQSPLEPFSLIIGNNDSQSVLPLVRAIFPESMSIEEIFVTERGVVAVRNAMITTALKRTTRVEWIACLDDDQVPARDWLVQLAAAGRRHNADLVGGPVRKIQETYTFWSGGATATDYLPTKEGPVELLNEAGNLLISAAFARKLRPTVFSAAFGRSGGEDYEFFLRARKMKARIFWAPDALVTEIIPHQRLTLRGLAWRAYSTSAYQTRADLLHGSATKVSRKIARNLLVLPAAVARTLIRERSLRNATSIFVRRSAGIVGNMAGLAGRRMERYGGDQ